MAPDSLRNLKLQIAILGIGLVNTQARIRLDPRRDKIGNHCAPGFPLRRHTPEMRSEYKQLLWGGLTCSRPARIRARLLQVTILQYHTGIRSRSICVRKAQDMARRTDRNDTEAASVAAGAVKPAPGKADKKPRAVAVADLELPPGYRPSDSEPFMGARQKLYFQHKLR